MYSWFLVPSNVTFQMLNVKGLVVNGDKCLLLPFITVMCFFSFFSKKIELLPLVKAMYKGKFTTHILTSHLA